jgi:hypothetical protein
MSVPPLLADGAKIKAARNAKKPPWSQERLAKEAGYALSVIQKLEQGTYFSQTCLEACAEALEVLLADLLVASDTVTGSEVAVSSGIRSPIYLTRVERDLVPQNSTAAPDAINQASAVPPQAPLSDNPLHALWDCLDPNLQDAFSLAYNKKRRAGSTRISTRDFFQALVRIQDDALKTLLESLPQGALPEPVAADVLTSPQLLEEDPLLSDCVAESLSQFKEMGPLPRKISPADVFVDVAKYGHGPSVARLRQYGVGPVEVEEKVQKLGLSVLRRTESK